MQLFFDMILMLQRCVGLMELAQRSLARHHLSAVAEHCALALHVSWVTILCTSHYHLANVRQQTSGGTLEPYMCSLAGVARIPHFIEHATWVACTFPPDLSIPHIAQKCFNVLDIRHRTWSSQMMVTWSALQTMAPLYSIHLAWIMYLQVPSLWQQR